MRRAGLSGVKVMWRTPVSIPLACSSQPALVRVFSGEDCIEGRWHEPIFPKFAAVCTLSNKIVWLNLERPKRSPFLFQIRMKPSMTDFRNSSMQILSFLPRDN